MVGLSADLYKSVGAGQMSIDAQATGTTLHSRRAEEGETIKVALRRVVIVESDETWVEELAHNFQKKFKEVNVDTFITSGNSITAELVIEFLNETLIKGSPDIIILPFAGIFSTAESRSKIKIWASQQNIPLNQIFFVSGGAVELVIDEGFSMIQKHQFRFKQFRDDQLINFT